MYWPKYKTDGMRAVLSCFYILYIFFTPKASAITCSICGQSNLTAPGECTNQFQYDCASNPSNGGQSLNPQQTPIGGEQRRQAKILCRTTRTKLGENQFAVIKECVTETEHLNRYPEGKAFGCETIQSNSTFPTTYCVCDQNLCNIRSIDDQLSQPQPSLPNTQPTNGHASQVPVGIQQQQRQQNRTDNSDAQNNQDARQQGILTPQLQNARGLPPAGPQQLLIPPQPVDEFSAPANPASWDANQPPPKPAFVQEPPTPQDRPPRRGLNSSQLPNYQTGIGTTPQLLANLNTERVEFLPESESGVTARTLSNGTRKAPLANGFACMVCSEGNLTQNQDCQVQTPLDCRTLFRPGPNLFCFTKAITTPTGQAQIEKRCASEEQLIQELGLPSIQPSCFSGQDGRLRIDYCICGSSKCNQLPIANQANMYPPLTSADRSGPPSSVQQRPNQPNTANVGSVRQTKMCYVCGESDQSHPSDCSQQYEYDCSKQYPQGSTVLCLTRQTKVASGRFNIEKRCITPAEHQLQYPDNEVTQNGCNEAWSGYVQYCVCQGDFCNRQNITLQQQAHHWIQKPTEAPEEDVSDPGDQPAKQQPTTTTALTVNRQPAARFPNGLLVPPSSRLPLAPSQPSSVTPATKAERTGGGAVTGIGNGDHESKPSSAPTTEAANQWDNRIRHEGQHHAAPSENSSKAEQNKKRGPPSLRLGSTNVVDDGESFRSSASAALSGFLNALALIVFTLLVMRQI